MFAVYFQKTIEDERERQIVNIKIVNNNVHLQLKDNVENNKFIISVNSMIKDHITNSLYLNHTCSNEELKNIISQLEIMSNICIDYKYMNIGGKRTYTEYLFDNNEIINSQCILHPLGIVYTRSETGLIGAKLLVKLLIKKTESQKDIDLIEQKGQNPHLYWLKRRTIKDNKDSPVTRPQNNNNTNNISSDKEDNNSTLINLAKRIKYDDNIDDNNDVVNKSKLPSYLDDLLI